jgi:two-component system cell cycle response regulator DivK
MQNATTIDEGAAMSGARILIVDDNAINIELVRYVLKAGGFEVATAANAIDAIAAVATSKPDLILMDVQMPGMDGLELTQRLKADPATRDIVVVACTAYAMKGDEARMHAAGCDGYLSKPIDVRIFPAQVRALLELGQSGSAGVAGR